MAKSKFKTVDMSEEALEEREFKLEEKRAKKAQKQATVTAAQTPEVIAPEIIAEPETVKSEQEKIEEITTSVKAPKARGKQYASARSQVDKTRTYSLSEGIELLKKIKFTKFDEALEVHLNLKEITSVVEVQYPHATGKTIRVVILNDEVMAKLEKGPVDFDVLLATPAQMGKITKFARTLGPKGLMPNPKNGTLINDPVKRKAELEAGKISIKGEKKAPLLHTTIGKISLPTQDLVENIETLIKSLGMGKVIKAVICTSMSPSIRVTV